MLHRSSERPLGFSRSRFSISWVEYSEIGGFYHVCRRPYFFHGQIQASPKMPLVLGMFQRRADMDRAMRIENQERLRTLKANHGDAVTIFNSHDPVDYENCRCGRAH